MEYLIPETAEVLAVYDHQYFSEYPAVTINKYGEGSLLYEGSILSDQIQAEIIKQALKRAGVQHPDLQFSWPLIAKSGVNEDGKQIHFYYNYSSELMEFTYPHQKGTELIGTAAVDKGELLSIKPWDLLIIEEL